MNLKELKVGQTITAKRKANLVEKAAKKKGGMNSNPFSELEMQLDSMVDDLIQKGQNLVKKKLKPAKKAWEKAQDSTTKEVAKNLNQQLEKTFMDRVNKIDPSVFESKQEFNQAKKDFLNELKRTSIDTIDIEYNDNQNKFHRY